MQAVPLRRRGGTEPTRWLLHSAIVGSFLPLLYLLSLIDPASLASPALIRKIQDNIQQASSPAAMLEWLPAHSPTRTIPPRDPSPPLFPFFTQPIGPSTSASIAPPQSGPRPLLPPYSWVQSHQESGLFAGPADEAPRFTMLPQWSYLKVLDSRPGWLLVYYDGDGVRQAGEAWIPAGAVGPIDTPRWLTNLRETPLYAGPEPDAPTYGRLPSWSVVEVLGRDESDRTLVRYPGDGNALQAGEVWVRRADLDVARAPQGSQLPWGRQPGSDGDTPRLTVPYRTQLDGSRAASANCGPSSVGMALESFGVFVPTGELRSLADWLQGNWNPNNGVAIEVLGQMVRRYELRALDLQGPGGRLHRWTLEDVRHHLRAGHPVIPQLRYRLLPGKEDFPYGYDHYIVLTGFSGDTFYYNDPIPNGGRGQHLAMSAATLLRAWEYSSEPLAALAVAR